MKGKRLLMICLALLVALSMMPLNGFAATKTVTVVGEKNYSEFNGEMLISDIWKETYNKKGQNTKSSYTSYEYDWSTGERLSQTKSITEYSYNKKGRLASFVEKEDGTITEKTVYTYKNGKVTKQTEYIYKNGKYVKNGYTTFNKSGKKETIKSYNKSGDLIDKQITEYNSKGLETKYTYYEGGSKKPKFTYTYKYHKGTKALKEMKCTNSDGSYWTNYYNKKEQMIKDVMVDPDGKSVGIYKYDSYGRQTEYSLESTYTYDGEEVNNEYKYIYKYSGTFNGKKKYPLVKDTYDEEGNLLFKTEYEYKMI